MRTVQIRPLQKSLLWAALLVMGLLAVCMPAEAQSDRNRSKQFLTQGLRARDNNDLPEAVKYLDLAITADKTFDLPRVYRADLYAKYRRYADASKLMQEATRISPNNAEFWARLGEYQMKDGKLDPALKAFQEVLKRKSNDAQAHFAVGQIYYEKKDLAQAEKAFLQAAEVEKGANLMTQYWLGKVHYDQAMASGDAPKLAQSQEDLDKVVKKLATSKQPPYEDASNLLKQIEGQQRKATIKKVAIIAVPIVVVVVLGLVVVGRLRGGGLGQDRMDLDTEAATYEEISASAVKRLCTMTQMAFGVMYVSNLDGDEVLPKATVAIDPENLKGLQVDIHEIARWVERNDGKPFLFAVEKKEGIFIKAFPDAREQLEPLEMRIGVPFLYQDRLLGMAFLGIEKTRDILKLKKLYERSQVDIFRMAVEVSAALYRIYEDEMAYIDLLTKFKSKRYVEENLPRALVNAEDSGRKGLVMVFEYDQYRGLEEQYGESQAQKILKAIADEVKLVIPPDEGMLARFDAGRFFAFVPVFSLDQARTQAEKVYDQICKARISRNLPNPTASVGAAVFPDHGRKADDLLWSAERVMLGISAAGGNSFGFAEVEGGAPAGSAAGPAPAAPAARAEAPAAAPFVPGFSGGPPAAPAAPAAEAGGPATRVPSWMQSPLDPSAGKSPAAPAAGGIPGFSGPLPGGSPAASPFGPPAAPKASPFGPPAQSAPPAASPFGPPAATAPSKASPFGPPAAAPPAATPFGPPAAAPPAATPFGPPAAAPPGSPFGAAAPPKASPFAPKAPPAATDNAPPVAAPPWAQPAAGAGQDAAGRRVLQPPKAGGGLFARRAEPQDPSKTNLMARGEGGFPVAPSARPQEEAPAPPSMPSVAETPPAPPAPPAGPPPHPSRQFTPDALDPLTGFLRHDHLLPCLEEEIAWSQTVGESCSIVHFQLDQYESILLQIGQDKMDLALKQVTSLVNDFLKEGTDVPARWADDSFVLLLPRTPSRIATNLAQQICFTVGNMLLPGVEERTTVSLGLAAFPEHAQSGVGLLECARAATQLMQQSGGNGVQVYTPA